MSSNNWMPNKKDSRFLVQHSTSFPVTFLGESCLLANNKILARGYLNNGAWSGSIYIGTLNNDDSISWTEVAGRPDGYSKDTVSTFRNSPNKILFCGGHPYYPAANTQVSYLGTFNGSNAISYTQVSDNLNSPQNIFNCSCSLNDGRIITIHTENAGVATVAWIWTLSGNTVSQVAIDPPPFGVAYCPMLQLRNGKILIIGTMHSRNGHSCAIGTLHGNNISWKLCSTLFDVFYGMRIVETFDNSILTIGGTVVNAGAYFPIQTSYIGTMDSSDNIVWAEQELPEVLRVTEHAVERVGDKIIVMGGTGPLAQFADVYCVNYLKCGIRK